MNTKSFLALTVLTLFSFSLFAAADKTLRFNGTGKSEYLVVDPGWSCLCNPSEAKNLTGGSIAFVKTGKDPKTSDVVSIKTFASQNASKVLQDRVKALSKSRTQLVDLKISKNNHKSFSQAVRADDGLFYSLVSVQLKKEVILFELQTKKGESTDPDIKVLSGLVSSVISVDSLPKK